MNLRKDHYRETSLCFGLAPKLKEMTPTLPGPSSPFREGLAGSDRHPCTTRTVNLGRAIRAVPAAAFRRRDEPPGPATGGLTTPPPPRGGIPLGGLAARSGQSAEAGETWPPRLTRSPGAPRQLYFRNTFPGVRQPMFHGWQVQELKSKKITILGGGSLGSCVDEERSQLRELM